MDMKVYQVSEADGICYKCKKHVMKDCECFFGKLFFYDQPERLNPKDAKIYAGNLPDQLSCSDPTISVCDSPNSENK